MSGKIDGAAERIYLIGRIGPRAEPRTWAQAADVVSQCCPAILNVQDELRRLEALDVGEYATFANVGLIIRVKA